MTVTKLATLAAALLASTAIAKADPVFNRIASFPVAENLPADADPKSETSAEIITASADGNTLIYSDSPFGGIGMIDITDARAPKPAGYVKFDGEPTSVAAVSGKVLVGVNTSESYTNPSGLLAVVDLASKSVETTCDLGGQPDSVAVSPDKSLAAVAIENERDEDVNDGALPQMPAGYLVVVPLKDGVADCANLKKVDLTGYSDIAPEDPEPEFVDINADNEVIVTLQENNHLVIVDGKTGDVKADYPAGTVALDGVDAKDDGALDFSDAIEERPREPDAVQWLGTDRFVIANEGDWKGGTRGFTIFNRDGTVSYESGPSFEMKVAQIGHYPDKRSDAKGVEPEGLEVAKFGDDTLIFLLAERGSVVGVYRDTGREPQLLQLLPSGISPEGGIAIPGRNLFATANEADLVEDGAARSHVMIYERAEGTPAYPQIESKMEDGKPIGWGALSALAADPETAGRLYSVSDSFYKKQPTIFVIDDTQKPAMITQAIRVTADGKPAANLDLEGITTDGAGGFWLASEGNPEKEIPHQLVHVDGAGKVEETVPFPAELKDSATRFGSEGIAKVGDTLWVAVQRPWKDDPKNTTKLLAYDTKAKTWGGVRYPLDAPSAEGAWVGLSEITVSGDYAYLIERDNLIGSAAKLKAITRVALADLKPATLGGDLPVVKKETVRDLLPDLKATGGYVVDKVEGFAIDKDGAGWVVTDNDGVDDSSGETLFFTIGKM
ncbi:esterase-like activity of phytase family protein [Mangrovibrevibacter kandeliae]|uniref:esterase-like activity of phytase family protein n=1 Tax=Mangrovibrevibacter kandeliae TaxID=2968473 RepID=UPI002119B1BE|nr:esterase-like activity of phytase family protein [Aurantimonas sp. CSK15Z-1]MCQ8784234.1 esterase-like activity of phytase family protein [Aurantimonas sp. CSK15Z-1]